jgi:hypothetical protein
MVTNTSGRKSQVAIEYCYIWKERHVQGHVFWIHASTQDRFEEAYKGIARDLRIPGWEDPQIDTILIVRDWLNNHENCPWLLALDNADVLELFFRSGPSAIGLQSPLIANLIPRSPTGSIILTTRDKRVGERLSGRGEVIMVAPLAPLEAELLFACRISKGDIVNNEEVQRLLEILEFIPLAITQAAAFIEENSMEITTYIKDLTKSDCDLQDCLDENLPDPRRDATSENSSIRTWKLSFDQITKQRPQAAELLSLMAVLDRQGMPKMLL